MAELKNRQSGTTIAPQLKDQFVGRVYKIICDYIPEAERMSSADNAKLHADLLKAAREILSYAEADEQIKKIKAEISKCMTMLEGVL